MFKKLLITTVLFAASAGCVFAGAAPYVGAALGVENAGRYNGLVGNIFGGYGTTMGQDQEYYFAGEAFADVGSIPFSSTKSASRRITYSLGGSLIPGLMLNKFTMAYARFGIASCHFTKGNSTDVAPQLGLGLQTNWMQHWDVRGEYVYTAGAAESNQFNLGLVYRLD